VNHLPPLHKMAHNLLADNTGTKVAAKIKLTMAQALQRYLCAQYVEIDGETRRLISGMFAIFGHGNVAGIGEAMQNAGDAMPNLSRPQRAIHGARSHCLCQVQAAAAIDGVHNVSRPWSDEYGDRGGACACESTTRTPVTW